LRIQSDWRSNFNAGFVFIASRAALAAPSVIRTKNRSMTKPPLSRQILPAKIASAAMNTAPKALRPR
jgi:hypothetical protein